MLKYPGGAAFLRSENARLRGEAERTQRGIRFIEGEIAALRNKKDSYELAWIAGLVQAINEGEVLS